MMVFLNRVWKAFGSLPVVLSALGLSCLFLALIGVGLNVLVPVNQAAALPSAMFTIIPGSTSTPYVPTATSTRIPTTTSNMPPTPLPGTIGVTSTVQISGTDGVGLNIREQPGLNNPILFVALDSEIFQVMDGPVVQDGFTWWFLVTPVDASRSGWAAADYLSLVPPP